MIIILNAEASLPNHPSDDLPTVSGDTLTYRGQSFDLSPLPEGATVEASEPFEGQIKRLNGNVIVCLKYIYDCTKAEDTQSSNPEDYTFNVVDGQCPDPILYKPEPEPEPEETTND